MINKILETFLIILLLVLPFRTIAGQPEEETFDHVISSFWNDIYITGGWTLYCGFRFHYTKITDDGKALGIEQIYSPIWMIKYLKCKSRMQCRKSNNSRFIKMEADLHNMYPVWQTVNSARNGTRYGIIDGEDWRFDQCDFERKLGITEPRPIARGNIARAIFYMHNEYGVPIEKGMLQTLKRWNREDPPSAQEKQRNDKIERIQGRRNPYIDNPALAERIAADRKAN